MEPDFPVVIFVPRPVLSERAAERPLAAVLVHDIPGHGSIVCHKFGVVEPVTLAITRLLGSNWVDAGDWINLAIGIGSLPLTMRVYTALQHVAFISPRKERWANKMLEKVVEPALRRFPPLH